MGKVTVVGGARAVEPSNLPPIGTALADCTPEEIQAIAQAGLAPSYWSVGDAIPITLNGTVGAVTFSNETYYAIIIGFDHNSDVEGKNTIHFQFAKTSAGVDVAFVDVDSAYYKSGSTAGFRMNTEEPNTGGWKSSYMRNTICPAFKSAMPVEWQNAIVACTKYTDNVGGGSTASSNVTPTSDDIFLLSEFEVKGTEAFANTAEKNYQKRYDYYTAGNSAKKYKHREATTTCAWFTRSVDYDSTHSWGIMFTSGTMAGTRSNISIGFAPAFVVG